MYLVIYQISQKMQDPLIMQNLRVWANIWIYYISGEGEIKSFIAKRVKRHFWHF